MSQSPKMYGASSIIFGKDTRRKIFSASWVHGMGFAFSNYNTPYTIIHKNEYKYPRHLVANQLQKEALEEKGYEAIAVGMPYIYTNPEEFLCLQKRKYRIYFPSHSTKSNSISNDYRLLIEQAKKYDCNSICLNAFDYDKMPIIQLYNADVKIFRGADSSSNSALIDIRNIFLQASHVVTNAPGSHIFYASVTGCVVEMYSDEEVNKKMTDDAFKRELFAYPKCARNDMELYIQSIQSKIKFNQISNMKRNELLSLSMELIGIEFKKSKGEIIELLRPRQTIESLYVCYQTVRSKVSV